MLIDQNTKTRNYDVRVSWLLGSAAKSTKGEMQPHNFFQLVFLSMPLLDKSVICILPLLQIKKSAHEIKLENRGSPNIPITA